MNNRKGFTLVELLAVIVILAILMVSAGAGVMATMNNSKVNTFKNEVLTMIDSAKNMYSEISMNMENTAKYLKSDNDSNYQAMCVSLNGLVANGYLDKDISTYGGVILVEVPYDGGETKYTAWVHNSTYGVNGVEKNKINGLKYKKSNNDAGTAATDGTAKTADDISGGKLGIVTKLGGINRVVSVAEGKAEATTMQRGLNTGLSNGEVTTDGTNPTQYYFGKKDTPTESYEVRGGTGAKYEQVPCINHSLT